VPDSFMKDMDFRNLALIKINYSLRFQISEPV